MDKARFARWRVAFGFSDGRVGGIGVVLRLCCEVANERDEKKMSKYSVDQSVSSGLDFWFELFARCRSELSGCSSGSGSGSGLVCESSCESLLDGLSYSLGHPYSNQLSASHLALLLGLPESDLVLLLDHYGGLLGFLSVPVCPELVGVGDGVAERRRLSLREVLFGLVQCTVSKRVMVRGPGDVFGLLAPQLSWARQEQIVGLALNARSGVIAYRVLALGGIDSASLDPCTAYRWLLEVGAASWIMVHNHPSGEPTPSPEDIALTRRFYQAGLLLRIELLDHIVIGHNAYESIRAKEPGAFQAYAL